ncbi:MAG: hypothetical protein JWQ97_2951 [Phenylobacterium sp.]|nr:hypothetical protein [Phenylobacterium sp.]
MTPDLADLLHHHRRTVAELEDTVSRMQLWQRGEGGFGTHEGDTDTTSDSISRTLEQIERLKAVIDKHDPDGFTALV